jgi:hypothetical protein
LIQLITTGQACVGNLPAQAGLPFEVETEAQAERLIRKGYATLAGAPEEPHETPAKGKRKKEG